MSVISVSSLKGGVGKTTVALHLAHGLARAGYQTLLIDCDLSCHASRFLGIDCSDIGENGVGSLIRPSDQVQVSRDDNGLKLKGVTIETLHLDIRRNMDFIAGTPDLRTRLRESRDSFGEFYLRDSIRALSGCYSFIVLDTGPELNLLTRNALRSSSMIIIPTDGSMMSVDSFSDLIHYDCESPSDAHRCVLRNMFNRSASRTLALSEAAIREKIELVSSEYGRRTGYRTRTRIGLLESVVRRAEIFNQLSFLKRTAYDPGGSSAVAQNFDELIKEVLYLNFIWSEEQSTRISTEAAPTSP